MNLMQTVHDEAQARRDEREREKEWKRYYEKFCKVHGEPVIDEETGNLLFQDGFQYGSQSYQGPESPPPDDPRKLRRLLYKYWWYRHEMVHKAAQDTGRQLQQLEQTQASRSVKVPGLAAEVRTLQARLKWLLGDRNECLRRIRIYRP